MNYLFFMLACMLACMLAALQNQLQVSPAPSQAGMLMILMISLIDLEVGCQTCS